MSHPQFITNPSNGQVFMITAPLMPNAPLPISATTGPLPLPGPSTPRGSITPAQHHMSPQQYSPQQISQFSQHLYHQYHQHQQQQRFQLQLQTTGHQLVQQQIQHHQQQQQQQHHHQQQQQQQHQLQINKQKQESNHLPKQSQPIINNNQQQSTPKPTKHQATQSKASINIKEKCINHYIDGQIIIESLRPLSEKKHKKKKKQKLEKEQDQDRLKERIEINKKEPERVEQPKVAQVEIPRPEQPRPSPVPIPEESPNSIRKTRDMMATWSTLDVKKFIEGHKEISIYAPKFADEEIDGPALLQLIDKNSFQILTSMFKHGPAIKIEAVLSNYKLNE